MKAILIGTYFGEWPVWLPAFLASCGGNRRIDWLFVTDCSLPPASPANVRFWKTTLEELNQRASRLLHLKIQKEPYAQLDLRPAYGIIFEEETRGYDFWGHCDFDVIWGDIYNFIPPEILHRVDIASSRKHATSGHLTFWRNKKSINNLYRKIAGFEKVLEDPEHRNFDERIMSRFLRNELSSGADIRVHWPEKLVVGWPELERRPRGWTWKNGKLYDRFGKERFYMHFMTWKDSLRRIDFDFGDSPESFRITRRGIWAAPRPVSESLLDLVPIDRWLTEGFRTKEMSR